MIHKCPYNGAEIRIAMLTAIKKFDKYIDALGSEEETKKHLEKVMDTMHFNIQDADIVKMIAKDLDLGLVDIINSSNYLVLVEEKKKELFAKFIIQMQVTFDFTEKEVWAILFILKEY